MRTDCKTELECVVRHKKRVEELRSDVDADVNLDPAERSMCLADLADTDAILSQLADAILDIDAGDVDAYPRYVSAFEELRPRLEPSSPGPALALVQNLTNRVALIVQDIALPDLTREKIAEVLEAVAARIAAAETIADADIAAIADGLEWVMSTAGLSK